MNTLNLHPSRILTVLLLFAVVGIGAVQAQEPAADPGRAAYGRTCAGCHGGDARGSMGPSLVPTQRDADSLLVLVRGGRGQMPPMAAAMISDAEVAQVAQFLRSLSTGSLVLEAGASSPRPSAGAAATAAAPSAAVLAYGTAVSQAAVRGSAELKTARSNASSLLGNNVSSSDKKLVHYTAAYASWETAVQSATQNDARSAIADALSQLREAVTLDERFGEAYILMAAVQAHNVKLNEMPVPYDPGVGAALARAQQLDAKNPRLALARGIAAFLAPKAVGAGPNDAETELKRADSLFAGGGAGIAWPNWGRAQAQAWLGQVLATKGDVAGARQAYQSALSLQPDYVWVTNVLLPAIDKR